MPELTNAEAVELATVAVGDFGFRSIYGSNALLIHCGPDTSTADIIFLEA